MCPQCMRTGLARTRSNSKCTLSNRWRYSSLGQGDSYPLWVSIFIIFWYKTNILNECLILNVFYLCLIFIFPVTLISNSLKCQSILIFNHYNTIIGGYRGQLFIHAEYFSLNQFYTNKSFEVFCFFLYYNWPSCMVIELKKKVAALLFCS